MNASEAALLLGMCASFDRRTIGEADARAWALVLADVALDDAQHAVAAHYAESRDWIMPADVRRRVKAMRRDRLDRNPAPAPAADLADDPVRYRASLADSIREIANARSVNRALGNPNPDRPPAIEAAQHREPRSPRAFTGKAADAHAVLQGLDDFGVALMQQARAELGDVEYAALLVRAAELAQEGRAS